MKGIGCGDERPHTDVRAGRRTTDGLLPRLVADGRTTDGLLPRLAADGRADRRTTDVAATTHRRWRCGPVEPPRTVRCHGIELLLAGFSVVRIARADRILAPNLLGSPALPIYFTLLASSKSADHYR